MPNAATSCRLRLRANGHLTKKWIPAFRGNDGVFVVSLSAGLKITGGLRFAVIIYPLARKRDFGGIDKTMTTNKYKRGVLSLAAAKVREVLRFVRLYAGVYHNSRGGGDIPADDNFGKALVALAQSQRFHNYVEVGTAHGLGSTKRIADVLLSRPDSCCLWSVEVFRFVHAVAVRNWRNTDLRGRLILIHGAVAPDGIMPWNEVIADSAYRPDANVYSPATYEKVKQSANDAPDAMVHLPQEIDVLLLDGGELHSYGEYRALAGRAKIICLDDSATAIKNRRVREELLANDEWKVVIDKPQERNGWCIFCRREYVETITPILTPAAEE